MYSTARGHKWYCSTSSRRYMDFARATVSLFPALSLFRALCGPDKLKNRQTHNILQFNLHSELALPSTGSWLPSDLSST